MAWVLIYLFTVVDQIREAVANYTGGLAIAAILTGIAIFLGGAMWTERPKGRTWEEFSASSLYKSVKRTLYLAWFIPVFMWTVHTFLPTQKNLAILIGAGVTYEAVTSETGKRVGGKMIQLLEDKMDEALEKEEPAEDAKGKAQEESKVEASGGEEKPSGKIHGQSA